MTRKKKNQGFSLVELIVVVLIMAVIAVVLAPQIMKWVENSRLSTDNQNLNQLISNVQLSLAKEAALKEVVAADGDRVLTITAGNCAFESSFSDHDSFETELKEITGTFPGTKSSGAERFIITITVSGKKVTNVVGKVVDSAGAEVNLSID